jgi:hypothetical protein
MLAGSVLAMDLGNADANLPMLAAAYGVPCVGTPSNALQSALWPVLSVDGDDLSAVLERARLVLTDQGENEALCDSANEGLAGDGRRLGGE